MNEKTQSIIILYHTLLFIQVVEEVMQLLKSLYGFTFEQRGLVKVKGKGQLMTYYLTGRDEQDTMDGTPLPGQI